MAHTPGPWTVEHHGGPWHIFGANDERVGTYATSVPARTEEAFAVSSANARLIAAAPDLLAALKALFADYKMLADSGDAGYWLLEQLEVGKQALAAIAKAEGR